MHLFKTHSQMSAWLLHSLQLCRWHSLARGGVLQRGTTENRLQGRRGLRPCGTPFFLQHEARPPVLQWSPLWPPDCIIHKWSSGMNVIESHSEPWSVTGSKWNVWVLPKEDRKMSSKATYVGPSGSIIKYEDMKKYVLDFLVVRRE